ncbi:MAG: aminodeoxychorismate/anthranilate synthase component II [Planctomycetota bacterium]
MILIIDNYDSFTFNIVQTLGGLTSVPIQVYRNDQLSIQEIEVLQPDCIIISPGPGRPRDAGISNEVIRHFFKTLPILGVCLGHQCLAEVFGGKVISARRIFHGKTSRMIHQQQGIFAHLPSPFVATRYHSLIVEETNLPKDLLPTCYSDTQELMGLEHRDFPVYGVQFHPESFLTLDGPQLFKNFLSHLH